MMATPDVAISANVEAPALIGVVEAGGVVLLMEIPATMETPDGEGGVD